MQGPFARALLRLTARRETAFDPPPLLIELLERPLNESALTYDLFPFTYSLARPGQGYTYAISNLIPEDEVVALRAVVESVSNGLDPESVDPLTFDTLISVLKQHAAAILGKTGKLGSVGDLSELVAFEAIGLSRVLALAKDERVTEFYVDSDRSPVYLDHTSVGRCSTAMVLTKREREAIETHIDTFRGYTPDYTTPSLKNDLEIGGARLRISVDLDPIAVNRFSLDVRRLNLSSLSLEQLVNLNVLSRESAAFLIAWLERGGNVTIVGETGTGKTTLLSALDERLNPELRRIYIEDAVETADMLERGYHQLKLKVDPLDRGAGGLRDKGSEIVKVLHRSPDIVILSEIQSREHSRAFFHALSAGVRGIQTFHASSVEQALRRWVNIHGVSKQSLLDLGVLVQMARPDRLKPSRVVLRVCQVVQEAGEARVRDIFVRDRGSSLRMVVGWDRVVPPMNQPSEEFASIVKEADARLAGGLALVA